MAGVFAINGGYKGKMGRIRDNLYFLQLGCVMRTVF